MRVFRLGFLIAILTVAWGCYASEDQRECRFSQGPSNEGTIFEPAQWPTSPLATYQSAPLGIVRAKFDHFYLYLSYRALMGLPIASRDIDLLRPHDPCWFSNARAHHGYDATSDDAFVSALSEWKIQREKATGIPNSGSIEVMRSVKHQDFLNCNTDAFKTAVATLQTRLSDYGRTQDVFEWIRGQDRVFSNCKAPSEQPAALSLSAPRWLQLDRDYQRAAAHFYAGHYEEAATQFDAIATTADSPWREISPYLAARAVIRSVTTKVNYQQPLDTGKLAIAELRLQSALKSASSDKLRKDIRRMLQFVQIRTRPDEVLARLDKELLQLHPSDSVGQDVVDYWVAYSQGGGKNAMLAFASWITAMRNGGKNTNNILAIQRWQTSHELPWLIAALEGAGPSTPQLADLIKDAQALAPASPAYFTARYHLARLVSDDEQAIRIIDDVLNRKGAGMSVADANAFKRIGLKRATSIGVFARYITRESAMQFRGTLPSIDKDTENLINEGLPIDDLVKILAFKDLTSKFRQELMLVIWTRAFVLDRKDVLRTLAPKLKQRIPESADLVNSVVNAQDKNSRQALGAMLLARYPGMVGNVTSNITYSDKLNEIALPNMHRYMSQDGERENWWCGFPNGIYYSSPSSELWLAGAAPPKFLSAKSLALLEIERKHLRATPNATDYLSYLVMDWARSQPSDPRLPQALHMLVRSSRGGCVAQGNTPSSKDMFRHLHKYFPSNPWATLTKYHY